MNEDFVSFSLAKKLKEKGYTLDTTHHYDDNGGIVVSLVEFDERCVYPCPEIHQVLKWLREDKSIHIHINITALGWYYGLSKIDKNKYRRSLRESSHNFQTYEETVIAGIEYVIDNLI